MSRYRFLRDNGCDILSAGLVSFLNHLCDVKENEIRFLHVTIEFKE